MAIRRTASIFLVLVALANPALSQSWVDTYLRRADEQLATQPHWATPLFTTTPRIDQRIRYEFLWQRGRGGATTENIGNGKGVSFIPAPRLEVVIGIPPYFVQSDPHRQDGWGDDPSTLPRRSQQGAAAGDRRCAIPAFLGRVDRRHFGSGHRPVV